MEENTWNEKFDPEAASRSTHVTEVASQVLEQWKPTDYDIRMQSLSFAGSLIGDTNIAVKKKTEAWLECAKAFEEYLKTGDIKVVYEKSAL